MTMLERRGRSASRSSARAERRTQRAQRRAERRAGRGSGRRSERAADQAPPPSTGPDEETVRIARRDFRKRRNAGRWRRARPFLLAFLVLALLSGAVWLVFFSSYVTVRHSDVAGNRTVGEARIDYAAEVPTGTPLARVDLDAIRARVESIPAVRRAEVSRSWPDTVRIEVTERTPVAVIDQGAGLRALDPDGVLFGSYDVPPRNLPLVRTPPDTDGEALEEGARVIDSLPAGIARRVEVIEVSSVDEIELVLGGGRRVVWGSAEDSDQKAEVLAVLLEQPGNQIDVSVPGRPTTR